MHYEEAQHNRAVWFSLVNRFQAPAFQRRAGLRQFAFVQKRLPDRPPARIRGMSGQKRAKSSALLALARSCCLCRHAGCSLLWFQMRSTSAEKADKGVKDIAARLDCSVYTAERWWKRVNVPPTFPGHAHHRWTRSAFENLIARVQRAMDRQRQRFSRHAKKISRLRSRSAA